MSELIQKLLAIGGCDANTEWAKGYDDGVNNAINVVEEYFKQPTLNENQQIVLDWLKEEKSKYPELSIFGTLSVLFDESENRFMSLDVIDALNDLSNKQQADVFQSFSQWALEQEEE